MGDFRVFSNCAKAVEELIEVSICASMGPRELISKKRELIYNSCETEESLRDG
jgi:hypothetical protein